MIRFTDICDCIMTVKFYSSLTSLSIWWDPTERTETIGVVELVNEFVIFGVKWSSQVPIYS